MIDLMLAAILLQTPNPCHAPDAASTRPRGCPAWRYTGRSEGDDTWMDPASLRRGDAGFDLIERVLFARAVGAARSAIVAVRYDCTRRTAAALHVTLYDARGARIAAETQTGADAAPEVPPPGSWNARALTEFCPR